jgi:hypothetical protein
MEKETTRKAASTPEFRALLTECIAERSGGNVRDFAVQLDWSHTTLYEILRGQRKPSPDLVEALAGICPKRGAAFYEAAGRPVPARLADLAAAEPLAAYLLPEHVDYLQAEAERRETTPGEVLREAVETYAATKPE